MYLVYRLFLVKIIPLVFLVEWFYNGHFWSPSWRAFRCAKRLRTFTYSSLILQIVKESCLIDTPITYVYIILVLLWSHNDTLFLYFKVLKFKSPKQMLSTNSDTAYIKRIRSAGYKLILKDRKKVNRFFVYSSVFCSLDLSNLCNFVLLSYPKITLQFILMTGSVFFFYCFSFVCKHLMLSNYTVSLHVMSIYHLFFF